jgi:FkbM family methyltransferase
MSIVNRLKGKLAGMIVNSLSGRKFISSQFILKNRQKIVEDIFTYPSAINNGYLHIERTISLAKKLNSSNGKCIVDVGAATGIISRIFSENFPDAKIYSFEPIKSTFSELQSNTEGYKNIVITNKGLGSEQKQASINITGRVTSSSLFESSNEIDDTYLAESLEGKSKEEIIISTLDKEIPSSQNILVLKMDVQGFELEVLKGGRETLKRTDIILVELQNHTYYKGAPQYFDIDEFLRESGFVLFDIIPSIRKNEKLLEWDAVYVSQKFIDENKNAKVAK